MKILCEFLCTGILFVLMLSGTVHAESIQFVRTDTNSATSSSSWEFDDFDSVVLNDGDSGANNEYTLSEISGAPGSPRATAVCQGASQSRCLTGTSGTTYAPNIFSASQYSLAVQYIDFAQVIVNSTSGINTTFQLSPSVDPGIDTVVVTSMLQLVRSTSASGFGTGNYNIGATSTIGNVKATMGYGVGNSTISVSISNIEVWSDAIDDNSSYSLIIEQTVNPEAYIEMKCHSVAGDWCTSGPPSLSATGEANAACSMSAVGYNSSIEPPAFNGARIFVQLIVDDEEEQEPPVQVYP